MEVNLQNNMQKNRRWVFVTVHGGARNVEARNFLRTLYLNTAIAGDRYTRSMTLRLDTEAGKHRALKGETKLGN